MNTNRNSGSELARGVADGLLSTDGVDVCVCPPFPYLLTIRSILRDRGSAIAIGSQDVYQAPDGAYTGEVSISMLKDCGVQYALVGHSERRHVLGEKDEQINKKVRGVLESGLTAIFCIGETLDERNAGHEDIVTSRQIRTGLAEIPSALIERLIIAYEPVWAIGTGKTASPQDAQDMHANIRTLIGHMYGPETATRLRIIYGGSVKSDNAAELFAKPDIDGGLIGGASLKSADFVAIAKAAAEAGRTKA